MRRFLHSFTLSCSLRVASIHPGNSWDLFPMMMTVYRHHDDTNDNIDGIEVMQLKKDKWEAWVVDILVEGI